MRERRHVASSDGDFVDYLKRLGRQVEAGLVDHPEPETLLAYHRGELDEAAADAVVEHITFCRSCTDLVLAIPAFLEEEEAAGEEEERATVVPFPFAERDSRRSWWPLAACLVAGLGVGYLVGQTGPTPPAASFRVAVSEDAPGSRGEAGEPLVLDFRGGQASVVVVLTPPGTVGEGPFRGRVTTETGRVLLAEAGVTPTPNGTFVLVVPRGALPEGDLRAEIASESDGAVVGQWPLRVLLDP